MKFYRLIFFILSSLILIFSCVNKPKKSELKKEILKESFQTVPKKEVVQQISITNKNVRSFFSKYASENPENLVLITTNFGKLKIILYDKTPLHRASFIRLIKSGFYDNTLFYRIVNGFIIQGGDSDDDDRKSKKNKAGKYKIPSEFNPKYFHKKGALAMTRDYKKNPKKSSASFDFYIVQGEVYSRFQLDAFENEYKIKISQDKRDVYKKSGGAPHLDGEHTVFGEVIEGFDVIDKIASVKTDRSDWPVDDVYIRKIEIVK